MWGKWTGSAALAITFLVWGLEEVKFDEHAQVCVWKFISVELNQLNKSSWTLEESVVQ